LAAAEALRRNPKESLSLLDGYLVAHGDDGNALMLALRLLYEARSAGERIFSAPEDTERARRYADLYRATGGPSQALVDRWVTFIAGK
jgi:hypothetical protein